MKGLIYKDNVIFLKSFFDKRSLIIIVAAIIGIFFSAGLYAGLLASAMLAMMTGIQNIVGFAYDENTDWKKYQRALPLSPVSVVGAQYISIVCSLTLSITGSIVFNLISSLVYRKFDITIWAVSFAAAIIVPLLWTGVGIPLAYWFGFNPARMISFILVFPLFYFIRYFEDEAGYPDMMRVISSNVVLAAAIVFVFFILSMMVSVAGYGRKK